MKTSFAETTQKKSCYTDMETEADSLTNVVLIDDKAFWRIEDCPKY